MEYRRDIDATPAPRAASPALWPAVGVLAGTCAVPHLGYLPPPALVALVGLGLALGGRAGWTAVALGVGLLNAALQPAGGPGAVPRRPVEVVATVAGHPVHHDDSTFFPTRVRRWRIGEWVRRADFDLQVTLPPDAAPPAIGSIVRLRGYLKRSPGYANGLPARPGPWRMRLKTARFLTVEQPPAGLTALAGGLRRRAEAAFEGVGGPGAALARALLLGDRSRLPPSWQAALRRSGLAHVLAVSGLHVGLLAVILVLAGTALPPRLRYLPAVLGIALYLLLIGPRPAVLRASLMGLLALGALALHRPPQALNALACCAATLALIDPQIAGRLGFQLSVAATAGILVLAPVYAERWRWLPAALRQPLAATVAAQLATLPWTIPLIAGVHPLAPLLNLVAVPLLAVFLLLSFIWLALATASSAAGCWLMPVLDVVATPVELLARTPPGPAFFLPVAVAGLPAAAVAAAVLGWPAWGLRAALLAALLLQTGAQVPEELRLPSFGRTSLPEVVVFDVGQGDAILLRDGDRAVMIDGGGWPHGDFGGRVLVPALATLGVGRLDAVVLTHPDRDHCGGLVDLGRYLPVAEVWVGPGWADAGCAARLLAAPSRWRVLWRGESERSGGWRLEVLHPAAGSRHGRNDRSLVLAARHGRHRLLLTGDIGARAERQLAIEQPEALAAGLLKVAHHGSKSSTGAAFLRAVAPRLALISAGVDNPHGHPHPSVLERLRAAGVRVLRTDRSGMLRLKLHPTGERSILLSEAPRRIFEKID